jgi:hypothetical protein
MKVRTFGLGYSHYAEDSWQRIDTAQPASSFQIRNIGSLGGCKIKE